jgi:hypothetical protein
MPSSNRVAPASRRLSRGRLARAAAALVLLGILFFAFFARRGYLVSAGAAPA